MNDVKPDNPQAKALSDFQRPRITGEDCAALEVFKENNDLVMAFRNLLFGFDLTDKEKYFIEDNLDNDEVKRVIKKMLYPQLEREIVVGQNMDLWMTTDITNATDEDFDLVYRTKAILIGMIETSIDRIEDIKKKGVRLAPDMDLAFLKARIAYINHTTAVIQDIIMNAHRSSEPVNKLKNSTK